MENGRVTHSVSHNAPDGVVNRLILACHGEPEAPPTVHRPELRMAMGLS